MGFLGWKGLPLFKCYTGITDRYRGRGEKKEKKKWNCVYIPDLPPQRIWAFRHNIHIDRSLLLVKRTVSCSLWLNLIHRVAVTWDNQPKRGLKVGSFESSKAARPRANCPPAPSVLGSGYKSCSFERGLGCMWQLQEAPFGLGVPPEQQAHTEHHSKHIPMATASQGPPLLPAPQHPPHAHPCRGLGPLPHSRYPREPPSPLFGGQPQPARGWEVQEEAAASGVPSGLWQQSQPSRERSEGRPGAVSASHTAHHTGFA